MSTVSDTNDIRQELAVLTSRVDALEARLAQNGADTSPPFDLASIMPQVRAITEELFPGKCEFMSKRDPEYPEDRYVEVRAEARGEIEEIVDRCEVWDERIRQKWPHLWDTLLLLVVPR